MSKGMKPFRAWIALSQKMEPAWFLGYHPTKALLQREYFMRFGHTPENAGYKAQRVTVKVMTPTQPTRGRG